MLNVKEEIKQSYKNDGIKGEFKLQITRTNYDMSNVLQGSLEITESLCSKEDLDFSCVEKGCLKVTLINIEENFKNLLNKQIVLKQIIGNTTIPYGVYRINNVELEGDNLIKVIAYDSLHNFDVDVSGWWNSLSFPTTVTDIFVGLCQHIGSTWGVSPADISNNLNWDIEVKNTVKLQNVSGLEILGYLQEVLGVFFKARRADGGIIVVNINTLSESVETYNYSSIISDVFISDYTTTKITKLQIKGSSNDIGCIVGTGTNTYVISNNPLLYGLTDEQLRPIATNILERIKDIEYTPFSAKVKTLPYLEVGDCIQLITIKGKVVKSPILQRVVSGTLLYMDTIGAKGKQNRKEVKNVNREIKVLNQKLLEIVQTVDENSSKMSDELSGFKTEFRQTANELKLQAEQTKYFNLIYNSDFEIWENDKPKGWVIDNIEATQVSMVEDTDFPTGKALKLKCKPNEMVNFYQQVNINRKCKKIYISIDYKMLSYGSGGTNIGFRIEFKDKRYTFWWNTTTDYHAISLNKYNRLERIVTFHQDFDLADVKLVLLNNNVGFEIMINRVFMTTDLPSPPKELWNKRSAEDIVSQISLLPDGVKISGSKVDVTGLVTFRNISDVNGQTVIDGGKIQASVINAPILQNIQSINGVSVNATGDVTCVNWDGQLVKLRYNNGIVTNFYTFMSDSNSGGGINGTITIDGNQLTFKGGILRKVITKGGSVMGTD